MNKQQIIDYKVIDDSVEAKSYFNDWLERDVFTVLGTFKNEYSELFVIYKFTNNHDALDNFITGDEFGWGLDFMITKSGMCYRPIGLSKEEVKEAKKILRGTK